MQSPTCHMLRSKCPNCLIFKVEINAVGIRNKLHRVELCNFRRCVFRTTIACVYDKVFFFSVMCPVESCSIQWPYFCFTQA